MASSSQVPIPMSTGHYITKDSGDEIDNVSQYQNIIGALQYVTLTRPKITFSANKLSQFLSYLRTHHWEECERLLRYLKGTLHIQLSTVPIMWCDNQEEMTLAYNPFYHDKTKHVELDMHFIRDKIVAKKIQVYFIPHEDQTVNVLTKALTFKQFHYLCSKLDVHPGHFSLRKAVSESNIT